MANKLLVNTVRARGRVHYAGSLLDTLAENTAEIAAAGGRLYDPGDPILDTAAVLARTLRARGAPESSIDSVMIAALAAAALAAAEDAGGGPTEATASSVAATTQSGQASITVGSTTATNQAATLRERDYFTNLANSAENILGISETTPSITSFAIGEGIRNGIVVFPAGWEGGDLVWTGTLRGAVVSETFTSPGIGGGTVIGSQLFSRVTLVENTAPGGNGAHSAQLQLGTRIGTTKAPVASFEKVSVAGIETEISASDLVAGWVDVGPVSLGTSVEISYAAAHTHGQDAHGHTATDAGHGHTQTAHTHTITLS